MTATADNSHESIRHAWAWHIVAQECPRIEFGLGTFSCGVISSLSSIFVVVLPASGRYNPYTGFPIELFVEIPIFLAGWLLVYLALRDLVHMYRFINKLRRFK